VKLLTIGFMTELDDPEAVVPDLSSMGLFQTETSTSVKDLGDKYFCEKCGQMLSPHEVAASLNGYKMYEAGCCPFLCNQCCIIC
jgi:hypothetical protein